MKKTALIDGLNAQLVQLRPLPHLSRDMECLIDVPVAAHLHNSPMFREWTWPPMHYTDKKVDGKFATQLMIIVALKYCTTESKSLAA